MNLNYLWFLPIVILYGMLLAAAVHNYIKYREDDSWEAIFIGGNMVVIPIVCAIIGIFKIIL